MSMQCLTWLKSVLQVAAFRATLEEISESSLLVHVVDIRFGIFKPWLNWVDQTDVIISLPDNDMLVKCSATPWQSNK